MSVTKLEISGQLAPVLMRRYNRRIARNIWIALRDQKLNSIRGQERFAEEVYDVLTSAPKLPTYQDGEPYEIPDTGISYKTIDNFANKASEIFRSVIDGGEPEIRVANKTLAYLHAYLFLKHPDRVSKWRYDEPNDYDNSIVRGLDDSFDLFTPNRSIESSMVFFAVRNGTGAASSRAGAFEIMMNITPDDERSKRSDIRDLPVLLGAMILYDRPKDLENDCVFLSPEQWRGIRFSRHYIKNKSSIRFNDGLHIYRGKSLGMKLRNLYSDNGFYIPNNSFAILSDVREGLNKSLKLVGFQIDYLFDKEIPFNLPSGVLDSLEMTIRIRSILGTELDTSSIEASDGYSQGFSLMVFQDIANGADEFKNLCRMMK